MSYKRIMLLLTIIIWSNISAQVPEPDSLALVALYNSTDGINWTDNTGWLTGPVSSWFGITAESGTVSQVQLQGNNLEGEIPPDIGNLTNVSTLYLHNNQITGSLPSQLGNLVSLTRLYLSNNQLTGSIPPELGSLTNLVIINFTQNQLNGSIPAQLGNMAGMEMMMLNHNQLEGAIPPEISNCSNITDLYFDHNQLNGSIPPQLADLPELHQLRLNDNEIEGAIPPELGNVSELRILNLSDNQIGGSIPSQLGYLGKLTNLSLDNNQLTGPIPPELENLTNLQILRLHNNQLKESIPPGLGELTALTTFTLYNNKLTGAIPYQLGNLTNLTLMNLENNQLTGSIPSQLMNLVNLTILSLNDNQLTGSIPPGITDLTYLYNLRIQNNHLSDLPDLSPLSSMTILYMENNRFTFEDIEPNLWISDIVYSPQDSVGEEQEQIVFAGSSLTLSVDVGGVNNVYQWYRNDAPIAGADTSEYVMDPVSLTDEGSYHCQITNTAAVQLQLYSRPVHVHVETVSSQDSLALVALYNSTNGANWTHNDNWLSGPITDWYGIQINNGRVTHLFMYENNLDGPIPAEISDLDTLVLINFWKNKLSGSIPPELCNLQYLYFLNINNNQLTGSIPVEIGQLHKMRRIELSDNQLSGPLPDGIGSLDRLQTLYIHSNQLEESIPPSIGYLPNLRNLDLSNNLLSGAIPSEIGNITTLENLNLGGNQLEGEIPVELCNLKNMEFLTISSNQLTGAVPDSITNLMVMEKFYLYRNQLEDLPDLSVIPTLRDLNLFENRFTFEDLEPNMVVADFNYIPQDSVGEKQDTTVTEGQDLTLSMTVGGTANQYQWYKDAVEINGADSSALVIENAAPSDSGSYTCQITNTVVTDLTLYSRPILVHIAPGSDIADRDPVAPARFALYQNYPNPFNPETTIDFSVKTGCHVTLKIFNLRGREVAVPVNRQFEPGLYKVKFSSRNLPSGLYFYAIRMKDFYSVKKMVVLE